MSYHRSTGLALSGVSSRVYGRAITPRDEGLAGISSRVYGRTIAPTDYGFGDVDPGAGPELTEVQWRAQMLAYNKAVADKAREWVIQDRQIRYLQLAATLAIPLSGMFWKWFLGRRGAKAAESITT